MFGKFKSKDNKDNDEPLAPNGYYEGEIVSSEYTAQSGYDFHDMWPHGKGKMTATLEDGTVETYEGEWNVGKFHGNGKLVVNGKTTVGRFEGGVLVTEEPIK